MRGLYTASRRITNLDSARTLMYIQPSTARVIEIISAFVSNESEETNEQLMIALQFIDSIGSPTATTITPTKHEAGDQAANSTIKANVTAGEPTYTNDGGKEIVRKAMSTVGGWRYRPSILQRPRFSDTAYVGLRLLTTPSTPFNALVSITFKERGALEGPM